MKILVAYLSYSGNTEEVAELIEARLRENGVQVDMYEIGFGIVPNVREYDFLCLGSFTWDYGGTPDEVKDFILEVGYKPDKVAVLGTGDIYEIGFGIVPNVREDDFLCIGSFTWDYGGTPDEVKDFILEVGYKPENVAVFGTGDTQFGGDELYCLAVDKLVRFYQSKWPG